MGWLKKLVGFENNFTKNILGDIGNDPSRLITGIDPFSTKAWNGVLGTDNEAMVNPFGSPGQQYYDRAQANGIDTGPAGQFHGAADVVAGMFGANGLAGIGGGAAGAGTGGAAGAGAAGGGGAAGGAAAGGGGLLSAIGGPSGALQLASGIGGALAANKGASKAGDSTVTTRHEMDPRVGGILFGDGGNDKGLLAGYRALGQTPQDPRLAGYGNANLDYLGNASTDMGQIRDAASGLLSGANVPKVNATGQGPMAHAAGNMVNAPKQNGINLAPAYDKFINGNPAENPYLKQAIQGGIGQSQQAFSKMQEDSTRNLHDVLGSIRGNSVLAGQLGGSRQGVAEGRAIGDMQREQQRAIQNFGDNNTTAAVGAQAGAFDRGQDRSLSAMQGLGAQQYGVASQDANTKNTAEFMNVGRTNDINADYARRNDAAQLANQGAQMQGTTIGAGLLSGAMGNAAGAGQNQQNFALNQASQANGLLSPYLGQVPGSSSTTQPLHQNTAGNLLGGAMAGLGLYNQFKQAQGGTGVQPYGGAIGNPNMPYGSNGVF